MTQDQALDILKTGANVFLTGEPGAGKTHTINRYTSWLRDRGVEPAITASTGIAATHVGGMTIHAWSGVGVRRELSDWDVEAMLEREPLVKRVRLAQVLIIDEVSMLDGHLLDLVERAVRALRGSTRPFGGLQVIFVGDFFQLPPVSKEKEPAAFAFESEAWQRALPLVCYLSEQHRQEDADFLEILGAVRGRSLTEAHRALLAGRAGAPAEAATRLYPHNADVDRINDEALTALAGAERAYVMREEGSKTLLEALKRGCLSPGRLAVKEGAAVMFTRNNFDKGYVNGTLGTVEGYSTNGFPLVRTRGGRVLEAEPAEWRIEDGKRVLAKLVQVPLRLAWAITVHKSQGMSLDAAVMDLSQAFEYGQGYVALSRVRSLAGLYLSGFNARALEIHPDVAAKDEDFRVASESAEEAFQKMNKGELAALQRQFIRAIGGREPEAVAKEKAAAPANKLEKMREKHPNAYRPWSKEDDAQLTELFREQASVASLVKTFGRQRGAIHSRLIRLGLVEPDL